MLWIGKVEEIHSEAKSVVTETFQKCCFRILRNEQVAWFCTNCDEPHRRAAIQTGLPVVFLDLDVECALCW
jgi:hypothetical protein